jgi:hypothetical protein
MRIDRIEMERMANSMYVLAQGRWKLSDKLLLS